MNEPVKLDYERNPREAIEERFRNRLIRIGLVGVTLIGAIAGLQEYTEHRRTNRSLEKKLIAQLNPLRNDPEVKKYVEKKKEAWDLFEEIRKKESEVTISGTYEAVYFDNPKNGSQELKDKIKRHNDLQETIMKQNNAITNYNDWNMNTSIKTTNLLRKAESIHKYNALGTVAVVLGAGYLVLRKRKKELDRVEGK
ncbi:MAG TPA: hypothetical protein VJK51_05125 [Candidatus Nanoarchaeia archaeon]|nr:hypothetical protein [Candidatus Nanoarchaeia archaeon]